MVCMVALMVRLGRTRLTVERSPRRVLTNWKREIASGLKRRAVVGMGNPQITQSKSLLRNLRMVLGCEAAVDAGQTFGSRENVIDDRIADFAVEIAQLRFRLAVDRYTEGCDAFVFRLPQRLARVLARVTRIAVIVIVRTPV